MYLLDMDLNVLLYFGNNPSSINNVIIFSCLKKFDWNVHVKIEQLF